jgi:hypothetical protein
MNIEFGRKLEMMVRVIGHCEANSDDNAGFVTLLNGLKQDRVRAEALAAQQRAGQLDARAATSHRMKLRNRTHHHLLVPLARVASSAAAEEPEVDKVFKAPRLNSRNLVWRTAARGMLAQAQARKELFLRHGMTEGMLTELAAALDEFDGTTDRRNTGRDVHIAATAELNEVIREGMRKVDVFDGLNLYRFRDQPEKLAQWDSVKNVPTPTTGKQPPLAPAA